jgi:hypothetical protein
MEFEFSFPCSEEPAIRSYTEPDICSHILVFYIRKFCFNIILSLPHGAFSSVTFSDSITLRIFILLYYEIN